MAERNASAIKIVGRQLHRDHIALNDFDEKFSHLAGNVGQDQMLIFQAHPKKGIREYLDHSAGDLDSICFGCLWWSWS